MTALALTTGNVSRLTRWIGADHILLGTGPKSCNINKTNYVEEEDTQIGPCSRAQTNDEQTHAYYGIQMRGNNLVSYRLRFCTMSMGRLTAQGDPHIFPLRTLKERSEGARNTEFVGKLIFHPVLSFSLHPLFM